MLVRIGLNAERPQPGNQWSVETRKPHTGNVNSVDANRQRESLLICLTSGSLGVELAGNRIHLPPMAYLKTDVRIYDMCLLRRTDRHIPIVICTSSEPFGQLAAWFKRWFAHQVGLRGCPLWVVVAFYWKGSNGCNEYVAAFSKWQEFAKSRHTYHSHKRKAGVTDVIFYCVSLF
jgi:hypothetical protein